MFEEADLIVSYSRAEAIRDGVLIDVSARAKLLGYRVPVALTAGLHCPAECLGFVRSRRYARTRPHHMRVHPAILG